MSIQEFITALEESLANNNFVKFSLGSYKGAEEGLKSIHGKRILVKREEKLSFTYRYKTRDIVKNYDIAEACNRIKQSLQKDFQSAILFTTEFDIAYDQKGIKRSAPTQTEAPSLDHDRQKTRFIETAGKDYLRDLKITDATGIVFKNAQDKYRQINKYVEILSGLIKSLPTRDRLNIVDMGSGKGYLTFALYDYVSGVLNLKTRVTGVEYRPDMVDLCNKIARNSKFDDLQFVQGSIEDYKNTDINILIALHACDTATDDAIYKGIQAGADLIVVAPCCHKQIRREIEKNKASNDIDFLMQHGIFMERESEMITDGLRGLILEYCGYSTKIFEFISDEHTAKNIMIVAVKDPKISPENKIIRDRIEAAKAYFGIGYHHLERLLKL